MTKKANSLSDIEKEWFTNYVLDTNIVFVELFTPCFDVLLSKNKNDIKLLLFYPDKTPRQVYIKGDASFCFTRVFFLENQTCFMNKSKNNEQIESAWRFAYTGTLVNKSSNG